MKRNFSFTLTSLCFKLLISMLLLAIACLLITSCSAKTTTANDSRQAIDIDFTILSDTIVYAELNHMLSDPDNYLGKTVKIQGAYYNSYSDITDQYYHYVTVLDTTACCTRMVEFVWQGEHAYPAEYPEADTKIELVGVVSSAEDEAFGMSFYFLAVDDIVLI
ncbi:MAG: hypothetical protein FWG43_03695 [Clostridiales bacterium]|nr:hypothetical protein [Clostridiales bacterium]